MLFRSKKKKKILGFVLIVIDNRNIFKNFIKKNFFSIIVIIIKNIFIPKKIINFILLFFIFFLIMYAYMVMEPVHTKHEYKKIYIEKDDPQTKDYNELIIKNSDDFEKTYYANRF